MWHDYGAMKLNETDTAAQGRKTRKAPRPLTKARLDEMALAYVARFATSAGKLEAFLSRKLRERGWEDEGDGRSGVEAVVARFVALGYVDDAGFAEMRSGSLLRRGYGARRIAQDLNAAGIEAQIREDVAPGEGAARRAALAHARKKGLGPYTRGLGPDDRLDPALREKQVASLLRAGHAMGNARAILALRSPEEAEQWLAEAEDDEPGGGFGD